jgi:Spy/CpxP family protein refolding chaperone
MNTKNIKSISLFLTGVLMVTALSAQSPRQGIRGLDLSEEQQSEMTTLRTDHNKAITPLRNKMGELKARERTLLSEDPVDMKAVKENIDEQSELTSIIRMLQVEYQVAVKKILTDEQVMKLQQPRQYAQRDGFRRQDGHRDFRGPRMGRCYRRR